MLLFMQRYPKEMAINERIKLKNTHKLIFMPVIPAEIYIRILFINNSIENFKQLFRVKSFVVLSLAILEDSKSFLYFNEVSK